MFDMYNFVFRRAKSYVFLFLWLSRFGMPNLNSAQCCAVEHHIWSIKHHYRYLIISIFPRRKEIKDKPTIGQKVERSIYECNNAEWTVLSSKWKDQGIFLIILTTYRHQLKQVQKILQFSTIKKFNHWELNFFVIVITI